MDRVNLPDTSSYQILGNCVYWCYQRSFISTTPQALPDYKIHLVFHQTYDNKRLFKKNIISVSLKSLKVLQILENFQKLLRFTLFIWMDSPRNINLILSAIIALTSWVREPKLCHLRNVSILTFPSRTLEITSGKVDGLNLEFYEINMVPSLIFWLLFRTIN